jgi:excisionase family DNA binding protein
MSEQLKSAMASPAPINRASSFQWLTLKEASEFLGVHFTTLRNWADKGEIPAFRTPGGHRRFSPSDLRRFLEARVGHPVPADVNHLVDAAIGRVREEIQKIPKNEINWNYYLDEAANDLRRQRGRQLFALALAYVLKPNQRACILEDGRRLGWEYGREAATNQVSLVETGRAVQFFRSQLIQILRSSENTAALDADDVRIQQWVNQFLDEVLYAVLAGYEQSLSAAVQPMGS